MNIINSSISFARQQNRFYHLQAGRRRDVEGIARIQLPQSPHRPIPHIVRRDHEAGRRLVFLERIDFRPRVPRPQFAAPRWRNANHAAGARKRKQQRDAQQQACRETGNMLSTRVSCFLVTHSRSRAGTALFCSAAPCSHVADLKSLASHRVMGQHGLLQTMSCVGPNSP